MSGIIPRKGCEQFGDSYDLYVLGSLEDAEAKAFAEHLLAGCAYCEPQLQRALSRTQAISQAVPLVDPPARLRLRLASSIGAVPRARRSFVPWLLPIAASLLLAGVALWAWQGQRSERQLSAGLTAESVRVSSMLQILAAPGTVELPLTDSKDQTLHGALYVHKKLGMAMVVDSLPAPPSGWIYESWVIPTNGAPHPIESFATDVHGRAITVLRGPVEVDQVDAMMISMERTGSVLSKPTTLVFSSGIKKTG